MDKSGDELDAESSGEGALNDVEAKDLKKGMRRGPANKAIEYFEDPIPTTEPNGDKRWKFPCGHCDAYVQYLFLPEYGMMLIEARFRTVERTVGKEAKFDDEPTLPKLNNLSSHMTKCKKARTQKTTDSDDEDRPNSNAAKELSLEKSRELMRGFLRNGELDPNIPATQRGFLRLFAAWILDEDLPWTTGEAPTLAILFKYLKIRFVLPSDTTVRNQLGHIFAELHGKVVRELSVSPRQSGISELWLTFHPERQVEDRIRYRHLDHPPDDLQFCVHHWMLYRRRLEPHRKGS